MREHGPRDRPQLLLQCVRFGIALTDEDSEQHPGDVGVEDGGAFAKRKTSYRAGGVGTDALERTQRLFIIRQCAIEPRHGLAGNRLQATRPDVVAERIPRADHVGFGRRRKGLERWIAVEPLAVLGQNAVHLRLLQHHFRDKDVVRVAGLAPGQ